MLDIKKDKIVHARIAETNKNTNNRYKILRDPDNWLLKF